MHKNCSFTIPSFKDTLTSFIKSVDSVLNLYRFLKFNILVFSIVPIWLYGQNNVQTTTIYDEYEAGRRIINEIIIENHLENSLKEYAYGGYFAGPSLFLIIKETDSFFEIYQGKRDEGILNTYKLDLTDKRLNSLFSWTEHDEIVYDVQSSEYSPIYFYFVLYDNNHNKKIEFNTSTMLAYKNSQKSKKLRKTLPFTKDQQVLIWKLLKLI